MIVVATDANCSGLTERKRLVEEASNGTASGRYASIVVAAIPDPHIERWLLLDSAAFKAVLGKGCSAPDQKCQRDRYKQMLRNAVRDADVMPLFGGVEHAADIVNQMNLQAVEQADTSFRSFLQALRAQLKQWGQ
jgi:hypothetical protein